MTDESVVVKILYLAKPDQVATAAQALGELIRLVVIEENDCLGISMHQEIGHPERMLLIEEWTSSEAYAGPHMETLWIKQFISRAPELFLGPPEITHWARTAEELPE